MLRILWNSKSAMNANQEKMDAISNNIANVNTGGYKRIDVSFKDLVSESLNRAGYPVSANSQRGQDPFTGTGVRASRWIRDDKQGNVEESKKSTDFAIDGDGYFQVTKLDGSIAYSRTGSFTIDAKNRITDENGNILNIQYKAGVNPENVKFTPDNFIVESNGDITMKNGNKDEIIGKIPVYNAVGAEAFVSIGDNLYIPSNSANVQQETNSSILQGYVENSNVDIAKEMTDMIITQRAFELGSKGIKTADDMWAIANNIRGK